MTTTVGPHWLVVMEFHHAHALYPAFSFAFLLDKGSCPRRFAPNWCTCYLMLLVTIWSESGCPQRFGSLQLLQNQDSFISFMQHVYTNEKKKSRYQACMYYCWFKNYPMCDTQRWHECIRSRKSYCWRLCISTISIVCKHYSQNTSLVIQSFTM